MKAEKSIYSYPRYYEIGFCKEDLRRETGFIFRCHRRHRSGAALSSVLDNGCGTGHYLEAFARKGVRVGGYDLSPDMTEHAHARLARITSHAELFQADMRDFATRRRYDMAINMNGSFQHLLRVQDVVKHLRCVARCLKKGGLYLICLPALEDVLRNPPGSIESRWTASRGGVTVSVDWTHRQSAVDWNTQTFAGCAKIRVNDSGRQMSLDLPYRYRVFFPQEMRALARLSGHFQVEHMYSDFHLGRTYGKACDPKALNVLLRKVRQSTTAG